MTDLSLATRIRVACRYSAMAYRDDIMSGWSRMCIGKDSMIYRLAADSGTLYLIWMGTGTLRGGSLGDKIRKWTRNVNALDRTGTGIHDGFERATMPYIDAIHAMAADAARTVYMGHSLGGAMALIAASHIGRLDDTVYACGAPKAGSARFVSRLSDRVGAIYDVVCGADCVPSYPPHEIGYRSAGLRITLPVPPWHNWPVLRRVMRIHDHYPEQYVRRSMQV